ncbi:MAG TPA: hypothetical protein VJY40_07890, partial [Corynebacterium sp.]|nr:hypothetical protein [Corynebacterium sp.]
MTRLRLMTSGISDASFDDDYVPPSEPDLPEDPGALVPAFQAPERQGGRPERRRNRGNTGAAFGEYRQPPHDREAEQGVLGAMLLS